jgi:hypothetical protein
MLLDVISQPSCFDQELRWRISFVGFGLDVTGQHLSNLKEMVLVDDLILGRLTIWSLCQLTKLLESFCPQNCRPPCFVVKKSRL